MYATFTNKNVVSDLIKGHKFWCTLISCRTKIDYITRNWKALGKPSSVKENGEDKIYVYKVNNQYELKFVIPKSTGKVDHISVFSPEDSINKMAG